MSIDPQAGELNDAIRSSNSYSFECLSERGKAIYFPKKGILSQSAEAKGKKINATIGTALEEDNTPMTLDSINSSINLDTKEPFSYAPSPGQPGIRSKWKEMMVQKNPSLQKKSISQPVVSCALTHGLSMAGYLFVNSGDEIISPDLYWENYDLIFSHTYGGIITTYPMFTSSGKFNIDGLNKRLHENPSNKKIVILNFPNNPTGYTITKDEASEIVSTLTDCANKGNNIVVLIDDAYFGLVFEDGILSESIFSYLCNSHERILAVKFDGPTKEDYVWGFRVGFVTFGSLLNSAAYYAALEGKIGGAIRGTISNSSNLSQAILLKAYSNPQYVQEKQSKFELLKGRYEKIVNILKNHPEYSNCFHALPFNSGYFMCVKVAKVDAEPVRIKLLEKYSTGIIAQGTIIRVAFSSVPTDSLEQLFENLYNATLDVLNGR